MFDFGVPKAKQDPKHPITTLHVFGWRKEDELKEMLEAVLASRSARRPIATPFMTS